MRSGRGGSLRQAWEWTLSFVLGLAIAALLFGLFGAVLWTLLVLGLVLFVGANAVFAWAAHKAEERRQRALAEKREAGKEERFWEAFWMEATTDWVVHGGPYPFESARSPVNGWRLFQDDELGFLKRVGIVTLELAQYHQSIEWGEWLTLRLEPDEWEMLTIYWRHVGRDPGQKWLHGWAARLAAIPYD